MKGFKKFLLYVGIFLAAIFAAVLICFAVMYFSPGTTILGYRYILYDEKVVENVEIATPSSASIVSSFEIRTGMTDVYVYPNYNSYNVKISHNQGISGYVHAYNSTLKVTKTYTTKTFEESTEDLKTLVIEVEEPTGWISNNNAYICVYVPTRAFNTCNVVSKSGKVTFLEQKEYETDEEGNQLYDYEGNPTTIVKTLDFENVYLKTGDFSDAIISTDTGFCDNYYLTTDKGDVVLNSKIYETPYTDEDGNEIKLLSKGFGSDTFKFTTNSGGLTFSTVDNGGMFTANKFIVRSYDRNIGPYIKIDYLVVTEKFDVNSYKGRYNIDYIVTYDESVIPLIAMTVKEAKINFGNVYGQVSILGEGGNLNNNIKIDHLISKNRTNAFENGAGNVNIGKLEGSASFDSTSGNVKVSNITVDSNIYAYSTSGDMNINYNFSKQNNYNTKLVVITHTGNINLNNVSCLLEVQVLSNSASSSLDIAFSSVIYKEAGEDNIINAKNRNLNMLLKGSSDYLQFRVLCLGDVFVKGTANSIITATDKDYLLSYSKYSDFTKMYRIGYTKDNTTYNEYAFDEWGKLLVTTTGDINVLVDLSANN